MENFKDKVVVVTGAGGTLCSEISIDLAKKGAKLVLVDRSAENLKKTTDKIDEFKGTYATYNCDVTSEEEMNKLADEVLEMWGPCRYLINGAGGNSPMAMTTNTKFDKAEISDSKPEEMRGFFNLDINVFEGVIKLNTLGTVIACRAFGKQMAEAGEGGIINFASMNAYCPLTRVPAYAMSKAAISNYTQWLAAYMAPAGVRVNAIAPGFFVNERSRTFLGTVETGLTARGEQVINHTPSGRFGEAKDLLGCVEWLLSDDKSSFVTGITIPVDGGFLTLSGV